MGSARLGKRPGPKPKTGPVRVESLGPELLERKALAYLDRFDASVSRLRRILTVFVEKRARQERVDPGPSRQLIEPLLARYQASGLLSDERFARGLVRSLWERGASRKAIVGRLRSRGVDGQLVERIWAELVQQGTKDAELQAAVALVRRRRLGCHRPVEQRQAMRHRDLGVLARAGFDRDTAQRALGGIASEEEDF